ncbi:MAG: M23 family metallopeptidase [Leptospirales bacterium]|nr:M23 family metallopeptidase [Leptospirales bacterium]
MNKILVCFSIIVLALSNLSFSWPVNPKESIVTSTFGESRSDHFHDGIDMISPSDDVYPVGKGTLLYTWNRTLFPLENYWGGGNYKVISHDDGSLSIYMHLQDVENLKQDYGESDIIGLIGNTGHSYGKHLHFSILDPDKRESINPLKLLPAYSDNKAPEIMNFYIRIDDKYIRLNDKSDIRLTKHYPLLIEIKDTFKGNENLGLYNIKVSLNGKPAADYTFDKISCSAEGLLVNNKIFIDIFDDKGYYKIKDVVYKEGINRFSIIVSDFNGNISEKDFTLNVKLDM